MFQFTFHIIRCEMKMKHLLAQACFDEVLWNNKNFSHKATAVTSYRIKDKVTLKEKTPCYSYHLFNTLFSVVAMASSRLLKLKIINEVKIFQMKSSIFLTMSLTPSFNSSVSKPYIIVTSPFHNAPFPTWTLSTAHYSIRFITLF